MINGKIIYASLTKLANLARLHCPVISDGKIVCKMLHAQLIQKMARHIGIASATG